MSGGVTGGVSTAFAASWADLPTLVLDGRSRGGAEAAESNFEDGSRSARATDLGARDANDGSGEVSSAFGDGSRDVRGVTWHEEGRDEGHVEGREDGLEPRDGQRDGG